MTYLAMHDFEPSEHKRRDTRAKTPGKKNIIKESIDNHLFSANRRCNYELANFFLETRNR